MKKNIQIHRKNCRNKKADKFLTSVVNYFPKVSEYLFGKCGECRCFSPLIYGEKELNSILFPAIKLSSKDVFLEFPIGKRHVDYCVWYENNKVFLIEFKHSWSVPDGKRKETITNPWKGAEEQLENITIKEIEKIGLNTCVKKITKIILMICTVYNHPSKTKKTEIKYFDKSQSDTLIERMEKELEPKPNWSAVWILPTKKQEKDYDEVLKNKKKKYLVKGFIFLARIFKEEKLVE